jgi:hypothetical protein
MHAHTCPFCRDRDDSKEGERKKLASKIHAAASSLNAQRFSPKMTVLDLQVRAGCAAVDVHTLRRAARCCPPPT